MDDATQDFLLLLMGQTAGLQADIANRAITGRGVTRSAMNDWRRTLVHLTKVIDDRTKDASK